MVQIVKFKTALEPGDEKARMYVVEDRGETLYVRDLHPYQALPSSRVVLKESVEDGLCFLENILMVNIERTLADRQTPITQFFDDIKLDYSNITLQDLQVVGEYLDVPVPELLAN